MGLLADLLFRIISIQEVDEKILYSENSVLNKVYLFFTLVVFGIKIDNKVEEILV